MTTNSINSALIPIVIGVTGHRDLRPQDLPMLRQRILELLQAVKGKHPDTPLILLTPLAEGADTVTAEVALELGAKLIAPLPLPKDDYLRDFKPGLARETFLRLLGQCQHWFVVPGPLAKPRGKHVPDGPRRNACYAAAGAYVATHCHILLALWNGKVKDTTGGTHQVMGFKLRGVPPEFLPQPGLPGTADIGPVWQIVTPRLSQEGTAGEALTVIRHYPKAWEREGDRQATLDAMLGRIDGFNRDSLERHERMRDDIERSRHYLLPPEECRQLDPNSQRILYRHALSSALSMQFQSRRHAMLKGIFMLGVLAFASLEFYEYFYGTLLRHQPWSFLLLVLYIAILAAAFLAYVLANRREYQSKHLDYRALSEGLRVQFYWTLAGLGDDVSDYYLNKHSGELAWIREAIRIGNIANLSVNARTQQPDGSQRQHRYRQLLDHWLRDQQRYFQKAWQRNEHKLRRQELMTNAFFGLAVLIAAVMIFLHHALAEAEILHSFLGYSISLSFALAAAFGGYAEKMVFSEQAREYNRMASLFGEAVESLEELLARNDLDAAEALLRELGKEALAENSDWVLLHRARPMSVPKGG